MRSVRAAWRGDPETVASVMGSSGPIARSSRVRLDAGMGHLELQRHLPHMLDIAVPNCCGSAPLRPAGVRHRYPGGEDLTGLRLD